LQWFVNLLNSLCALSTDKNPRFGGFFFDQALGFTRVTQIPALNTPLSSTFFMNQADLGLIYQLEFPVTHQAILSLKDLSEFC
jgi:hypothetical protein